MSAIARPSWGGCDTKSTKGIDRGAATPLDREEIKRLGRSILPADS
jgi:hypothetical protein